MRKVIITDSFMWDSKDKLNNFNSKEHMVKCKLKVGYKYKNDSILFREFQTICRDIETSIKGLMELYDNNSNEVNIESNNKISALIYENEKSNLLRVVDMVDNNIRNIIIYPSHRFKKHLSKQNDILDLKIKFREGTSTSINSDVMESIYNIHNDANIFGKTLKDKTALFIDGLKSLNSNKIYNNGVNYDLYYKLDGYNTIMIGIENEFDSMPCRWLEIYESSLVSACNRRIFITATKISKTINHYLSNNPSEEDLQIVKWILDEYNDSNSTKYKLHHSNKFIYIDDSKVAKQSNSFIESMYKRGVKSINFYRVERYKQSDNHFVDMSLNRWF